jgi:preprotein translocase subunit SecG
MQTVLIVIHLMVVTALVIVVLLQRSEGGALGIGGGGGGGFFTGRGQANALTRATAILATLFFVTSIALTILAGWGRGAHKSILDTSAPAGQSAPADTSKQPAGGLLDELKKMQDQKGTAPQTPTTAPTAPAPVPGAPAAPRSQ